VRVRRGAALSRNLSFRGDLSPGPSPLPSLTPPAQPRNKLIICQHTKEKTNKTRKKYTAPRVHIFTCIWSSSPSRNKSKNANRPLRSSLAAPRSQLGSCSYVSCKSRLSARPRAASAKRERERESTGQRKIRRGTNRRTVKGQVLSLDHARSSYYLLLNAASDESRRLCVLRVGPLLHVAGHFGKRFGDNKVITAQRTDFL
jgi:hypothetical protein